MGQCCSGAVLKFGLHKTNRPADLHDAAGPDELAGLRRREKLDAQIDGRRKDLRVARDENGRTHAIIELGCQKSPLHIEGGIAEFGARGERDLDQALSRTGVDYVEPEQGRARRGRKAIKDSWNGHGALLLV